MNLKPSTYRDRGNSRDPCSQLSRSVAIIVPQHTTEPLTAFDVANNLTHFVSRFDDLIVEPLMVSLGMIMLEESVDSSSQRFLTEEDHSRKRLGFEAVHEPFNVGIQIRTSRRQQ